mmetsp:Transcript_18116/g.28878  ORF Transcript_18116/g.28878 Transcript_18116/m.28878 type:complete len:154 (-) Transcript_18116:327-788(-)|eukprot:jgi/Bigna1/63635/fgenesh1_kg.56_\
MDPSKFVIPTGGGEGAYYCVKYIAERKINHSSVTLLSISDDLTKYNKTSSRRKAEERIQRQLQSQLKCMEYCKANKLSCKVDSVTSYIPSDGKTSSERVASEVCEYATKNNIGNIMSGSRNLTGLKRWVVGSIGMILHRDCDKCTFIQVRNPK